MFIRPQNFRKMYLVSPIVVNGMCFRPLQRRCMTSSLQLHPWAVSPSQKVGPHLAGPAGQLSLQTSEKALRRPTTPSERYILKFILWKTMVQPFCSYRLCIKLQIFCTLCSPGSDWHGSDPVWCSIPWPRTKGPASRRGRRPAADPPHCGPSFNCGLWSHLQPARGHAEPN